MADVRCPMCGKANDSQAEACEFCGARIKPLFIEQPDAEPEARLEEPATAGESEAETPEWLARIRAQAEAKAAPELEEEGQDADGEEDDWLDRLRQSGAGEGQPLPERLGADGLTESAKEEPAPGEQPAEAADDEPDWLGGMPRADVGRDEGPPEGEVPEWLAQYEGDQEGEEEQQVPEWLARIRAREREGGEAGPALPAVETDWLNQLREGAMPQDGEAPPGEPPAAEPPAAEPTPAVAEVPMPEEEPEEQAQRPEQKPQVEHEPLPPLEAPAILSVPQEEQPPTAEPEPKPPAEEPDWLGGVGELKDETLPHVPALILETGEPAAPGGTQDLDLEAIDLPDWLGELKETGAEEAEKEAKPDLAPATLPAWLEAMRPVETFRPAVEIEPEEDQIVESAGPLAGLRGGLMAEPVVAMPRTPTIGGAKLDITERQFAQAELLHRMVEEEEREITPMPAGRGRLPLMRWALSLVLLLAVALPVFAGVPRFPLPSRLPLDLPALTELVNSLPTEPPVLVVFDYDPGYSGELDAVAGALFQHLVARELRIITVSTRPAGPPLAERLMQRVAPELALTNGEDYLHLGYLSGGPTAVQLFAALPREAILRGFLLPRELAGTSAWDSPLLRDVQELSDFAAVVVITAGTESARTWTEQARPWMGDTPLIMVLSMGAEPLVRPYYEALEPQVNGILTGLSAAVIYEQGNGRPAAAHDRWDGYGAGALAAELALAAGLVYGVIGWLLQPQRERG